MGQPPVAADIAVDAGGQAGGQHGQDHAARPRRIRLPLHPGIDPLAAPIGPPAVEAQAVDAETGDVAEVETASLGARVKYTVEEDGFLSVGLEHVDDLIAD